MASACVWILVVFLIVAVLVGVGAACSGGSRQRRRRRCELLDRSASVSRGAREIGTNYQSATGMADNVQRPADQNHFTKLNPNKMYGASNIVPHPNAGYQLTDCAFKNLTANSKNDPILDVAAMFPSVARATDFVQNTDVSTFPIGLDFPAAMRASWMGAAQPQRMQISERNGSMRTMGWGDSLIRGTEQLAMNANANVSQAAAKNPTLGNNMFGASALWYEAVGMADGSGRQGQAP